MTEVTPEQKMAQAIHLLFMDCENNDHYYAQRGQFGYLDIHRDDNQITKNLFSAYEEWLAEEENLE